MDSLSRHANICLIFLQDSKALWEQCGSETNLYHCVLRINTRFAVVRRLCCFTPGTLCAALFSATTRRGRLGGRGRLGRLPLLTLPLMIVHGAVARKSPSRKNVTVVNMRALAGFV